MTRTGRFLIAVIGLATTLAACSSSGTKAAPRLSSKQIVSRLDRTGLCGTKHPRVIGRGIACLGARGAEFLFQVQTYRSATARERAEHKFLGQACRFGPKNARLVVGGNFLAFSPRHTQVVAEALDGKVRQPKGCSSKQS